MSLFVSHRLTTDASCAINWVTSSGASRQDVVTMPAEVRSAATKRGLMRRVNAFAAGYVARKNGMARTTNPHQSHSGGWSRPLERCWYAGWDLAKNTDETQA